MKIRDSKKTYMSWELILYIVFVIGLCVLNCMVIQAQEYENHYLYNGFSDSLEFAEPQPVYYSYSLIGLNQPDRLNPYTWQRGFREYSRIIPVNTVLERTSGVIHEKSAIDPVIKLEGWMMDPAKWIIPGSKIKK